MTECMQCKGPYLNNRPTQIDWEFCSDECRDLYQHRIEREGLQPIKRPNWGEPFPPNMKLGNLTAAFNIRVTYQDRVQVTVMDHTVSGEDLQDALAQAFQVVALEQYTEGRTKGYEQGYSEARD